MMLPEQEESLRKIRETTEGWVAKYLNKPVSFVLTRRLMATSVTPNQITLANFGLALLASWFLTSHFYLVRLLAALLMQFSSVLDGCDGEVARLKNLCSKRGAWLDTIFDDATNNLFFLGLFLGLRHEIKSGWFAFAGWETLLASLSVSGIIYHYLLTVSHTAHAADFRLAWQAPREAPLKNNNSVYHRCLKPFMKRDFFILFMAVMVLLDQRPLCFWGAVVATNVTFFLYLSSVVYRVRSGHLPFA